MICKTGTGEYLPVPLALGGVIMKAIPSVWSGYFNELSAEQAMEQLAKAGFTRTELWTGFLDRMLQQDDPEKAGRELGRFAADQGVRITQGHMRYKHGLCSKEAVEFLKQDLAVFAGVGITQAVLHINGGAQLENQERHDIWVKNIAAASEFAEGTGITVCLENLNAVPEARTADSLLEFIEESGGKNLGICLDTGHLHLSNQQEHIRQSQGEFIRKAGKYLQAMHVASNSGLADDQQMPYSARHDLDWKDVISALRQIDYAGLFNAEIHGEREAPLPVKIKKLEYIRWMMDYMLSDQF